MLLWHEHEYHCWTKKFPKSKKRTLGHTWMWIIILLVKSFSWSLIVGSFLWNLTDNFNFILNCWTLYYKVENNICNNNDYNNAHTHMYAIHTLWKKNISKHHFFSNNYMRWSTTARVSFLFTRLSISKTLTVHYLFENSHIYLEKVKIKRKEGLLKQ